jgi:hypothetical protein
MSIKLERITASIATITPSNENGQGSNGLTPEIWPLFTSSHAIHES